MSKQGETFPDWTKVTPENCAAELPRLLAEAEKSVAEIEGQKATSYEDFVWRLDDATRELWRTWGNVSFMTSVRNSPAWRAVEEKFQPQVVSFSLRMGQSKALLAQAKEVLVRMKSCGNATGNETRIRILEKFIQGIELSGVSLPEDKRARFNEIAARLAQLSMDFSNAVLDATNAFSYKKDGKTYTIDDANYPQTMKTCADREVREALYRGRSTRAPENTPRITEILKLRFESAHLLGFGNPAELSIVTKSAPSVSAVEEMIGELDRATVEPAKEEARALGVGLEPWDIAYAAERLREKTYDYSEEELKKYFPFDKVLEGLFKLTEFLFAVEITEVTGAQKPSVWHPDVRFFEVCEKGAPIAHFYIDPYVRNGEKRGGAWMSEFRNRCDRRGEKPLAYLALNAPKPDAKGASLLPFREVETLFHEFGHALQCMLTRIGEEGAAGISLIEWDAVEVASQFMENWCLDDRTGIHVPEELKAKVRAARNFRAATACRRQLAFAETDMQLHEKEVPDPNAVKNRVFAHFGLEILPDDLFLNAFSHIFAGGYSAGYYGYKWSEVMSADCYGAFEEVGIANDAAIQAVGRAYRETILALGGSESAFDVFVRFRKRKPSSAALLRQQGLVR